jgi:shikimate dehydrogenase
MKLAVVGKPISHSLSPVLHLAAYKALGLTDWTYARIEADELELPKLVSELDEQWRGLSVTMPNKRVALELAQGSTARAAALGVANTLVHNGKTWFADCTDVDGVVGALRETGGFTDGTTGVVLGAGGTATAALAGFVELGVKEAILVVRDATRATSTARTAEALGLSVTVSTWSETNFADLSHAADVLVSTVPSQAVTDIAEQLANIPAILDVIYYPWPTELGRQRLSRHLPIATGRDMLLHQAFTQVELFTGLPAPKAPMALALAALAN